MGLDEVAMGLAPVHDIAGEMAMASVQSIHNSSDHSHGYFIGQEADHVAARRRFHSGLR